MSFSPGAQGRRPQLKVTLPVEDLLREVREMQTLSIPARSGPALGGQQNRWLTRASGQLVRASPRRGLSTSLHPQASLHQDHETPWSSTAAEPNTSSQLPSLAGKKQFLKTSLNNHTACYRTACSTSSHTVISSCGGPWGSYFITSCSRAELFPIVD